MVPAESISMMFHELDPDALSPLAGTEIRNLVTLSVAVPDVGVVKVKTAALNVGMPSLPLKAVQAASGGVPVQVPLDAVCGMNGMIWVEPVPSSIGQYASGTFGL